MRFKKARPLPNKLITALLSCDEFCQFEPVSIKTIRSVERYVSAIYQVQIQFKQHKALYWVKVHPEQNGCAELEYYFLRDVRERLLNAPGLSVLRPVAYLNEFNAIVTEHSSGVPLSAQVKSTMNIFLSYWRSDKNIKKNFYLCGKLLANLHEQQLSTGECYSSEQLFEYIDVRLKKLLTLSKLDIEFYDRLQMYFNDKKVELSRVNLIRVKTHGDYAPYNVLVSEDELVVFDPAVGRYFGSLDNFCSQYEDIIHFYKWSQDMFSPYVTRRVRDELASLFLQGYNKNSENPVSATSAVFEVFMVKYKILGVFDRWPSIISRLTNKNARVKEFEKWFDQITGTSR